MQTVRNLSFRILSDYHLAPVPCHCVCGSLQMHRCPTSRQMSSSSTPRAASPFADIPQTDPAISILSVSVIRITQASAAWLSVCTMQIWDAFMIHTLLCAVPPPAWRRSCWNVIWGLLPNQILSVWSVFYYFSYFAHLSEPLSFILYLYLHFEKVAHFNLGFFSLPPSCFQDAVLNHASGLFMSGFSCFSSVQRCSSSFIRSSFCLGLSVPGALGLDSVPFSNRAAAGLPQGLLAANHLIGNQIFPVEHNEHLLMPWFSWASRMFLQVTPLPNNLMLWLDLSPLTSSMQICFDDPHGCGLPPCQYQVWSHFSDAVDEPSLPWYLLFVIFSQCASGCTWHVQLLLSTQRDIKSWWSDGCPAGCKWTWPDCHPCTCVQRWHCTKVSQHTPNTNFSCSSGSGSAAWHNNNTSHIRKQSSAMFIPVTTTETDSQ